MIRRPPRSTRTDTTLSLHDALPISTRCAQQLVSGHRAAAEGQHRCLACGIRSDRKPDGLCGPRLSRSEEHTSELQSLMRISYAVFCLKKKNTKNKSKKIQTHKKDNNTHVTELV